MQNKKVTFIAKEVIKISQEANMRDDIIVFFRDNPDPHDEDLHQWADKKGYNIHKVETEVYKLATKYVKFLTGGRANSSGFIEKDADPKQLAIGIKVEAEHINDPDIQRRIAIDHLSEIPDYYTHLLAMEKELKN